MARLLEGKVALVTGAGHGIGRGHALELAKHGARVVINDLGGSVRGEGSSRDAEVVVDLIKKRGGEAIADFGDVGDETQADAMVQRGIKQWGKLDIVVNNAGIVRDKAIWNMSADDFDAVMRVHVRGSWLTSRSAARYWREAARSGQPVAGRIINTTSGAGLDGNFGQTNYATAKAAIVGLTLTLSVELASIGCTANIIGPGALTRISATMPGMPTPKEPDEFADDQFDPMDPAISSPLVAWLGSNEAGHVTGLCIKALRDKIIWMRGFSEARSISNGNKRWDAAKLGRVLGTDLFGTQASGLRFG